MRFGLALPQYGFSLPGGRDRVRYDGGLGAPRRRSSGSTPCGFRITSSIRSRGTAATLADRSDRADDGACGDRGRDVAGAAGHARAVRVVPASRRPGEDGRDDRPALRWPPGPGASAPGGSQEEFDAFGFPFGTVGERFDALEDTLAALVRAAVGRAARPTTDRRSRSATPMLAPRPVHGRVPVWVGGKGGPRLLRLAAQYADGWNAVWRIDADDYADRVIAAHDACEAVGRTRRRFVSRSGCTRSSARTRPRRATAFERGRATFPGGAMDAETWASWRADTLSGTPDQVIERVHELEAIGVEEIVVSPWVLPFAVHEPAGRRRPGRARHRAAPRVRRDGSARGGHRGSRRCGRAAALDGDPGSGTPDGSDRPVRHHRRPRDAARPRCERACWRGRSCGKGKACTRWRTLRRDRPRLRRRSSAGDRDAWAPMSPCVKRSCALRSSERSASSAPARRRRPAGALVAACALRRPIRSRAPRTGPSRSCRGRP